MVYGLSVYALGFSGVKNIWGLVLAAALAAFLGAFIGARLTKKVTLRLLKVNVGIVLMLVGFGIAGGLF